jgi:hypothetical protein
MTPEEIIKKVEIIVCKHFMINPIDLHTKSRKRKLSDPRLIVIYICNTYMNVTQDNIGIYYDRNRTICCYATREMETILKNKHTELKFELTINELKKDRNISSIFTGNRAFLIHKDHKYSIIYTKNRDELHKIMLVDDSDMVLVCEVMEESSMLSECLNNNDVMESLLKDIDKSKIFKVLE